MNKPLFSLSNFTDLTRRSAVADRPRERDRAMLRDVENFAESLKVAQGHSK